MLQHSYRRWSARSRGFTLVELAVTLAVMGIIAVIAVPSFNNLIRSNRLTSSANEMVALLQTARSAAISNRVSAVVCPSTDGSTCAAAAGSRWIARQTKAGVTTVLRDSALAQGITASTSSNLSGASNQLTFTPAGFSRAGTNSSGSIGVCSTQLPGNNSIVVTAAVGRISTARRAATAACTAPPNT